MQDQVSAVGIIDRPMRQSGRVPRQAWWTIGIPSFGEVGPVSLHGFTEGTIFRAPTDPSLWIELSEDVLGLPGGEGAAVGCRLGGGGLGLVEAVPKCVRF